MPTPREAYTNTVEQRAYSGERLQAADFGRAGEIIANAAQNFGQDLKQVGNDIEDIEIKKAETTVREADLLAQQEVLEKYHGVDGYFNKKGMGAVEASKMLPKELDEIRARHAAAIKDPRARKMFDEIVMRRRGDELPKIIEHAGTQNFNHLEQLDDGVIELSQDNAVRSGDPSIVVNEIATTRAAVERKARRNGITDPAGISTAQQKAVGGLVVGVASKLDMDGDATKAEDFVKSLVDIVNPDGSPLLDPDDVVNIMSQLSTRAEAIRARDDDSFDVYDGDEPADAAAAPVAEGEPQRTTVKQTPLQIWKAGVNSEYGVDRGTHRHGGMDIKGRMGDPVVSSMDGYVIKNGDDGKKGFGKYTLVDHGNGVVTRYAHLSAHKAGVGQKVNQGETVGAVGSTGRSTGPHLHYQIEVNGKTVDPRKFNQHDVVTGGGGGKGIATETGRSFNLAATIDRIEKSGLPEVAIQARISRAREKASRFEYQEAKSQEAINDSVYTFINSLPSPEDFQDTNQLPAGTVFAMSKNPKLTAYWRAQAESNKQTVEARARQNNREARGDMAEQARADMGWMMLSAPEKFMGINFRQEIPGLTSSDRLQLEETRMKMVEGQRRTGEGVDYSALRTTISRFVGGDGLIKEEKSEKNRARLATVAQVAEREEEAAIRANGGKPINQGVRDAIVARLMQTVKVKDTGKSILRGEQPSGVAVLVPTRELMRQRLKEKNNGIPPSENEIDKAMAYVRTRTGGR